MFRYAYYYEALYTKDVHPGGSRPDDWIRGQELEWVFLSAWEEHCLECAVPQCYGNCSLWSERMDRKCRKTVYGLKRRKDLLSHYPIAVQYQFRPWGKMETYVSLRAVSFRSFRRIDRWNSIMDQAFLDLAKVLRPLFPTLKPSGFWEVIKNKLVFRLGRPIVPTHFLLQCYSMRQEPYRLLLEMRENGIFFREAIEIRKGYNQYCVDLSGYGMDTRKSIMITYYPENNLETELLVFFSDLIVRKGKEKDSPKPADKVKCIVWDLDNTIWDGTLSESEEGALRLREGIREVLEEADRRGILHAVISKNDEEPVMQELKRLGIEDLFVCVIANWDQKSKNLARLQKTLNIGIDSFAFVDDSAYERADIANAYPCVRIYQETEIKEMLQRSEFDVIVTEESAGRRRMYQEEAKRTAVKTAYSGTDSEFIRDCRMEITVDTIGEDTFDRCFELANRTNQLNLSGKKYSREAFSEVVAEAPITVSFHAKDRYGDYGEVGFFLARIEDDAFLIYEFAMSCRVAEKMVESALLSWIIDRYFHPENRSSLAYDPISLQRIVMSGVSTAKNKRLVDSFTRYGMHDESRDPGKIFLVIDKSKVHNYDVMKVIESRSASEHETNEMATQ